MTAALDHRFPQFMKYTHDNSYCTRKEKDVQINRRNWQNCQNKSILKCLKVLHLVGSGNIELSFFQKKNIQMGRKWTAYSVLSRFYYSVPQCSTTDVLKNQSTTTYYSFVNELVSVNLIVFGVNRKIAMEQCEPSFDFDTLEPFPAWPISPPFPKK